MDHFYTSEYSFIDQLVGIPFILSDDSLNAAITVKGLKAVDFSFSETFVGGRVVD